MKHKKVFTEIINEQIGEFKIIAIHEDDPLIIRVVAEKTSDPRPFRFMYYATQRVLGCPVVLRQIIGQAAIDQYGYLCSRETQAEVA
jgi:hypothetical protein